MVPDLALPAALSQLLVAYTIECDTEFEQQTPHRTTRGSGTGPWLISMAMWSNFLRYLPADGATRAELEPLSQMVNLNGLLRWRYLHVDPAAGGTARDLVRPSSAGRRAQATWPRVTDEVDVRWESRFGSAVITRLRRALDDVSDRNGPDFMPVVGYGDGMRLHLPDEQEFVAATRGTEPASNLAAQLSRVLVDLTADYETRSRMSLTMVADVVRVIGTDGARVRDLPAAGGVSKEGIAAALTFLVRHGVATVGPDPVTPRARRVSLTDRGRSALARHGERLAAVERSLRDRRGNASVERLHAAVAELRAGTDGEGRPLLAAGLTPYPQCWRARRPYLAQTQALLADPCGALPHHPMVLHRGGYPDGS